MIAISTILGLAYLITGKGWSAEDSLELRFAPNCLISNALAIGDEVLVRVTTPNGPGTAAWVRRGQLQHWRSALDMWDVSAIGRSQAGEALIIVNFPDPVDRARP